MANLATVSFVEDFQEVLDERGDMFFSTGNEDHDFKRIHDTIKLQGFWSGDRVRYFFDMDSLEQSKIKLLHTERRF